MKLINILNEHVLDSEIDDLEYNISRLKKSIKFSKGDNKKKLTREKNELNKKLSAFINKKINDLYNPKVIEKIFKENNIKKSAMSKSYVVQGYSEIIPGYSFEKLYRFGEIILYKIKADDKLLEDFKKNGYNIEKVFNALNATYITISPKLSK